MVAYIVLILVSTVVSVLITPWVILIAERFGVMQQPPTEVLSSIKVEATDPNLRYKILSLRNNLIKPPTAKWGGLAYTLAFFLVIFGMFLFADKELVLRTASNYILWFAVIVFLLIAGLVQDKNGGAGYLQFVYIFIAAIVFAISPLDLQGINLSTTYLNLNVFHIAALGNLISIAIPGDLIVIFWTVLVFYAIKMQGGTDGLAEGNTVIALFFIALVSLKFGHNQAALLAFIWIGVLLGFLVYNFYPAYIFSGSSGKLVLGFVVASLAIISGAKLGTALIVLSVPLLDMIHVVILRIRKHHLYRKGSKGIWEAFVISDKLHLHHRFLKLGLSERTIALIEYSMTAAIGLATLYLGKLAKLVFLVFVWILIFLAIKYISYLAEKKHVEEFKS